MGKAWTYVALLCLGGCTWTAHPDRSWSVPDEHVADRSYITPGLGKYKVVVVRDRLIGHPSHVGVALDNRFVADIGNGEVLQIFLKPGKYHLAIVGRHGSDISARKQGSGIDFTVTPDNHPEIHAHVKGWGYGAWSYELNPPA